MPLRCEQYYASTSFTNAQCSGLGSNYLLFLVDNGVLHAADGFLKNGKRTKHEMVQLKPTNGRRQARFSKEESVLREMVYGYTCGYIVSLILYVPRIYYIHAQYMCTVRYIQIYIHIYLYVYIHVYLYLRICCE